MWKSVHRIKTQLQTPKGYKVETRHKCNICKEALLWKAATMTFKLEYLQQNLAECATFFSSKCLKESIPKIRYQQEAVKYYIQTQTLNSDEQQVLVQWLYTKSQTQSDTIPTEHSKLVHDIWSSPAISALTSNKIYFISTEIYPHRWQWWKNRFVFSRSQSATWTMKFH